MKKILTILLLVCNMVVVFAQDGKVQVNYSESEPYQPREFRDKKNNLIDAYGKPIKKKSSKSENKSVTATVSKTFESSVFIEDKDGKPILDLKKEDFILFINGEEKVIDSIEKNDVSNNIVLLLDISGSTDSDNLKIIQNFASQLVQRFSPQHSIKIMTFDEKIEVHTKFTKDNQQLLKAINKIKNRGGTSLYDAIAYTLENELEAPTNVFLITDAVDSTSTKFSYENSLLLAEKYKATFFTFYLNSYDSVSNPKNSPNLPLGPILANNSIGSLKTGYERGRNYLSDLAMISGGKIFVLKNDSQMTQENVELIAQKIQPHYYLKVDLTTTSNVPERIQIRLRVNRPNLYVRTRGSFIINQNEK